MKLKSTLAASLTTLTVAGGAAQAEELSLIHI